MLDGAGEIWAGEGRILAVTDERDTLYPRFQFDPEMQPKPVMAEVLAALPSHMEAWARAIWFATPNAYLEGGRPMDSLDAPAALLRAAQSLVEWPIAA